MATGCEQDHEFCSVPQLIQRGSGRYRIAVSGIPEEVYRYQLGSRSAVEWVIDRYYVKTDKASGIVNDPNDWSREAGDPRYILDLLARVVTVSVETMRIVDGLPTLEIRVQQ
jgi:predicted helicase